MKVFVRTLHCLSPFTTFIRCGVKGASIFMTHCPFNTAKGFVVDDLHCVYLGVVK